MKIARDKWKHFYVGIPMGAILQIITYYIMPQHFVASIVVSFILVISVSYGFEVLSLITKKGHYDIFDAVAGVIGGSVGMAITLLLLKIFIIRLMIAL
ncbi:MAG: hypothetical protein M3139_15935 [Bacteroidota bacterium]|nr:hypothetical protein [Bacteroidota bacterium]